MSETITLRTTSLSVAHAAEAVQEELRRLGIQLFAVIDHAAAAREAGLRLPDEQVLIFGSPAVGTALMQADARAGLDLPLRLLVWDDHGTTTLAYRDPQLLADAFALDDQDATLERLSGVLRRIIGALPG
jgi:uncharacterized protein (DUF302 family)